MSKAIQSKQLQYPFASWRLGLEALKTWDLRSWLAQTNIPTLTVFFMKDALLPSDSLQKKIRNSLLISDGGHAAIYSHPEECFHQLEGFWNEL
jgi:pimeloyl-ACP methyl ester carboxylesterase